MIARIWHGWTTPENEEAYYKVLTEQVIPQIESYKMEGYRKIEVLRREHSDETEFITIMYFDSLEYIKQFMGDDYEVAHVPEPAQKVLKRWDERSQHYEVKDSFRY
ncbi:antibiotic biosynthesis monooxygenase [bacterium]|nr:antibiotic biosynthesis monooxygenase [bacterium]